MATTSSVLLKVEAILPDGRMIVKPQGPAPDLRRAGARKSTSPSLRSKSSPPYGVKKGRRFKQKLPTRAKLVDWAKASCDANSISRKLGIRPRCWEDRSLIMKTAALIQTHGDRVWSVVAKVAAMRGEVRNVFAYLHRSMSNWAKDFGMNFLGCLAILKPPEHLLKPRPRGAGGSGTSRASYNTLSLRSAPDPKPFDDWQRRLAIKRDLLRLARAP